MIILFHLPDLPVCLLAKFLLVSLLLRINNDLLMWEPPPPPQPSPKISHSPLQKRRSEDDEFQLCKSAFRLGQSFENTFIHTSHNLIQWLYAKKR